MRAVAAGATLLLALAADAGPLEPYEVTTEPGVRVRCGPSKVKKVPGLCAMFTVSPRGANPWTAWANEDPPETVRTLRRGELLVVGDRELRLYTRTTRDKDSRTGALPATAKLLSALEMSERDLLPRAGQSVKDLRLDGEGHLIVRVAQVRYPDPSSDRGATRLEPVEVRVAIADGTMERVAPPRAQQSEDVVQDAAAPPAPPAPTVRAAPEAPPEPAARAPGAGPPPDRPTADPNFGKKGLKGYRPKGESSWGCSAVFSPPAALLAALAALLRRRGELVR